MSTQARTAGAGSGAEALAEGERAAGRALAALLACVVHACGAAAEPQQQGPQDGVGIGLGLPAPAAAGVQVALHTAAARQPGCRASYKGSPSGHRAQLVRLDGCEGQEGVPAAPAAGGPFRLWVEPACVVECQPCTVRVVLPLHGAHRDAGGEEGRSGAADGHELQCSSSGSRGSSRTGRRSAWGSSGRLSGRSGGTQGGGAAARRQGSGWRGAEAPAWLLQAGVPGDREQGGGAAALRQSWAGGATGREGDREQGGGAAALGQSWAGGAPRSRDGDAGETGCEGLWPGGLALRVVLLQQQQVVVDEYVEAGKEGEEAVADWGEEAGSAQEPGWGEGGGSGAGRMSGGAEAAGARGQTERVTAEVMAEGFIRIRWDGILHLGSCK